MRSASAEAELTQARHRLTALEAERDSNRQILESAAADLAAAQHELELSQQEVTAAAALAESSGSRKNRASLFLTRCRQRLRLRNQLAQAEERMAGADREARRLQTEITNANLQVEAFGGQRGQLALEFETVTQRVAGIREEISQLRQVIEPKRCRGDEGQNSSRLAARRICHGSGEEGIAGSGNRGARILHRIGSPAFSVRSDAERLRSGWRTGGFP